MKSHFFSWNLRLRRRLNENNWKFDKTSRCSYLAVVAALASEADYVFIPEDPVNIDWKEHLCKKLLQV